MREQDLTDHPQDGRVKHTAKHHGQEQQPKVSRQMADHLLTPIQGQEARCNSHSNRSIRKMPANGKSTPPRPQISRFRRRRASAPTGRYLTPLRATGISSGMITALKITADMMADVGDVRFMKSNLASHGSVPLNIAGTMAKYLARSLAMENVVRAPRVIRSCLPISTTSMSLVGSLSRSTMLPASLAAWVPLFMATPTSAWANAGASLVPSPIIATSFPEACSWRM